jgi:hypothetical protein
MVETEIGVGSAVEVLRTSLPAVAVGSTWTFACAIRGELSCNVVATDTRDVTANRIPKRTPNDRVLIRS